MIKTKLPLIIVIIMVFCALEVKADFTYNYKDEILSKIMPSYTLATIAEDCVVRESPNVISSEVGELKKGVIVEILQDSSEKWYRIENADEELAGWIHYKYLNIHDTPPTVIDEISDSDAEGFVNIMSFPSGSDFFVWTDIARQKTYVFKKEKNRYTLIKKFTCSTGKNTTPTTRGFFTVSERGRWFYSKRFDSGAMYWVRFNGTYLFHSVAMDKDKNVTDGVLGKRRSSGCIRLSVDDAKWIFGNIPAKTTVFIH